MERAGVRRPGERNSEDGGAISGLVLERLRGVLGPLGVVGGFCTSRGDRRRGRVVGVGL